MNHTHKEGTATMSEQDDRLRLLITDPRGKTSEVPLSDGTYVLGRNVDCEIRFPESASSVSRKHAKLTVRNGEATIADLESRAGTMVNGQVVREHEVQNDDVITISKYMIRLVVPETAKKQKPAPDPGESIMLTADTELAAEVQDLEKELQAIREATAKLEQQIARRIVGQERVVRLV